MISGIKEMLGITQSNHTPDSSKYHVFVSDRFSGIVKNGYFYTAKNMKVSDIGSYVISKGFNTEAEALKAFEEGDLFKDYAWSIKSESDLPASTKRIITANKKYYEELSKLAEKTDKMDIHLIDKQFYTAMDINFMVDEILLTDNKVEHLIQGAWVSFPFRGAKLTGSCYGTRYKFTEIELASSYGHSHFSRAPRNVSNLCWGSEMSGRTIQKLADVKTVKEGMTDVIRFLAFESRSGTPYIHCSKLFKGSSDQTYSFNSRELKIMGKSGALKYVNVIKQDHDSSYLAKIVDPENFTEQLLADLDFAEFFKFDASYFGNFDKDNGVWAEVSTNAYKTANGNSNVRSFKGLSRNQKREFYFKGKWVVEELVPNKIKGQEELKYNTFNYKTISNLEVVLSQKISDYLRNKIKNHGRNIAKREAVSTDH